MDDAAPLFDEYQELLDIFPYPVFVKNDRLELIYGNAAFVEMLGGIDFLGKTDDEMFPSEQVNAFRADDLRVLRGEESISEEEIGDDTLALTRKIPGHLKDGSPAIFGAIIARATAPTPSKRKNRYEQQLLEAALSQHKVKARFDRKMAQLQNRLNEADTARAEAQRQAHTDDFTGLRNRTGLDLDLEACIDKHGKNGTRFGLAILDLDHFKRINDRFGHATGDQVLQIIAKRIRKLPYVFSAARMGGDEFAIITEHPMPDLPSTYEDMELARQHVFRAVTVDSKKIDLSGSTGLSVFPDDSQNMDMLKRHADAALFAAKRAGRARAQLYNAEIHAARERRDRIEADLPAAIEDCTITPAFQPIVSSDGETLNSMEVLARWTHPELGQVSPEEFVAIAVDCGLVTDLDRCVRMRACQEAAQWLESGVLKRLSFNISATDIISPGFATTYLADLRQIGTDPSHTGIEILESALVEDTAEARRNLERLSEAGVTIALDDFGTGYSNLRALIDLPLDRLKIDRSLIEDIGENDKLVDMIVSITQLGQILDVDIIAEGVETSMQLMFVEGAGCHYCQGYFFAEPMTGDEAGRYVGSFSSAPTRKRA